MHTGATRRRDCAPRSGELTASPRRSRGALPSVGESSQFRPAAAAVLIPPRSVGHHGSNAARADDFEDLAAVARRDNAIPWADKLPRAVWRGSPTGAGPAPAPRRVLKSFILGALGPGTRNVAAMRKRGSVSDDRMQRRYILSGIFSRA